MLCDTVSDLDAELKQITCLKISAACFCSSALFTVTISYLTASASTATTLPAILLHVITSVQFSSAASESSYQNISVIASIIICFNCD
jgi:hypothetical protein